MLGERTARLKRRYNQQAADLQKALIHATMQQNVKIVPENRMQAKQLRLLELQVAQAIGYHVYYCDDYRCYLLVRPYNRASIPLGGLYTVRGKGPKRRMSHLLWDRAGYDEAGAWEWVPHFMTRAEHYRALLIHLVVQLRMEIIEPLDQIELVCHEVVARLRV